MNGRLFLLIGVTALFIRVWTTNDRGQLPSRPRARSQAASTRLLSPTTRIQSASEGVRGSSPSLALPVRIHGTQPNLRHDNTPSVGSRTPATIPAITISRAQSAAEQVWSEPTCPIPLPRGLADGTYRVVDDTGCVARLEVARTGSPRRGNDAAEPDFFMSVSAGRRWYFIRLKTLAGVSPLAGSQFPAPEVRTGIAAAATHQPALANRKFDFTGYVSQDGR